MEKAYSHLEEQLTFLPLYQSSLRSVNKYVENTENCNTAEYLQKRQVLNYLRAAILSRILTIRNNIKYDGVVVNVTSYLIFTKEKIEKYRKPLKQIYLHDNQYIQDKVHEHLNEFNYFIRNDLLKEINMICKETDKNITLLVNEIINQQVLEENKITQLKGQLVQRTKLRVVHIASQSLAI